MIEPSSNIWNMTKIVCFAPFFGGMQCHIIGFGGMIVLHMTSSWCLLLFLFQDASPAFCVRHAAIQGGSYHWDSFLKIPFPTRSIPHGECHELGFAIKTMFFFHTHWWTKIPSPVDINKGSEISPESQFLHHLKSLTQKNARWFKKVYNPNFRTSLIARWLRSQLNNQLPQNLQGTCLCSVYTGISCWNSCPIFKIWCQLEFLCCRRCLSLLGQSLQNIYPKAKKTFTIQLHSNFHQSH